ncbi:BA75_03825T0 [Komagataella pastoris]|uniref:Palmitoyltransferase n=1 Tax=Komagataella pastoris TaxID=4922 RepID=A0A1B2JGL4_PICPA|nr:BA75_03825T0 [Komagataella pastoris]
MEWIVSFPQWRKDRNGNEDFGSNEASVRGHYILCCGGKVKTAADPTNLARMIGAGLIIIAPAVLFYIFDSAWYWKKSPAIVILFAYTWLLALGNFLLAAFIDPGTVPRNIHLSRDRDGNLPPEYYNVIRLPGARKDGVFSPSEEESESNAQLRYPIEIKYCTTCNIWRPPRTSHCGTCDSCISIHDHHCVWLNNCVGVHNYGFFLRFLAFSILSCTWLIVLGFLRMAKDGGAAKHPISLLLGVYGSLGILYPLLLLSFHMVIIWQGITTREYLHLTKEHQLSIKDVFRIWRFNPHNVSPIRNFAIQTNRQRVKRSRPPSNNTKI